MKTVSTAMSVRMLYCAGIAAASISISTPSIAEVKKSECFCSYKNLVILVEEGAGKSSGFTLGRYSTNAECFKAAHTSEEEHPACRYNQNFHPYGAINDASCSCAGPALRLRFGFSSGKVDTLEAKYESNAECQEQLRQPICVTP
jgi:hypothetical protein